MFALRSWLRTPRLALALLACMALAIGGTTTVVTFVYALLLRPLPFPHSERLVTIVPQNLGDTQRPYLSYPNFADLRVAATSSFEMLEGATVSRLILQTPEGSERLRGETVTPGYFELLGVRPGLGRAFTAGEYAGRTDRAIILSSRIWRSRFGADPGVLGRPIPTRDGPAVVVGILPENYLGIGEGDGTDYWLAERQNNYPNMLTERDNITTLVLGRLKPGVTRAQADAELQSLLRGLVDAHPEANAKLAAHVVPLAERWREPLRGGLLTMLVGSGFLLLIGCGNVALLLLARLVDREREMALRLALGADRAALVRMLLGESLLLAAAGGALGILLASWLLEIFIKIGGVVLPFQLPVEMTTAPLAICVVTVIATGLLFGILPALAAARVRAQALHAGGRGVLAGTLRTGAGRILIIAQTALAVALLAGAALFIRSYGKLRHADFGFRTESLLRYQVSLPRETYATPEALENFYRNLATDLTQLPGVRRIGYMTPTVPPYDGADETIRLKGGDLGTKDGALEVQARHTTNETLSILGLPLRAGRLFAPTDRRGTPLVGLISETLARRIAPAGSALGRTLLLRDNREVEIVGIVADALWQGRRERHPTHFEVILSLEQTPHPSVGLLFDTTVDPASLIEPVRRIIVARDPAAALHWITTMEEALDEQTRDERFWTVLASAYAVTAFLLAVIGLYGVLSHNVASRRQEMGLRLALGATAAALARLVIGQGLRLVVIGVGAGLFVALALGRLLEARLYGITARDPLALLASAALLILVALVACWLPALRAARTDPMTALRAE